mgnify:CR=1 FL=1
MLKNHHTLAPMTLGQKFVAWLQLMRFDKPVGIELLLYPTLWALCLAALELGRLPSVKFLIIFALGVILMRAAGCAINDFADRRVDGAVARTSSRPLANGRLAPITAVLTFIGLALLAGSLLFLLPMLVSYYALVAVALAFIYPFMKRYTHLPQVVLAMAFGWAIVMAYVAVLGRTNANCWLLFVAYMAWTVAYDTAYAMCDRADDVQVGVKSTAILFGQYDVAIISALQGVFLGLMAVVLWQFFAVWTMAVLLPVALMFIKQYQLLRTRQRQDCFQAFLDNVWVGRWLFLAIAGLCWWVVG